MLKLSLVLDLKLVKLSSQSSYSSPVCRISKHIERLNYCNSGITVLLKTLITRSRHAMFCSLGWFYCSSHWNSTAFNQSCPVNKLNKRVLEWLSLQRAVVPNGLRSTWLHVDLRDINEMTTTDKLLHWTKQTLKLTTFRVYSFACYPLQLHKARTVLSLRFSWWSIGIIKVKATLSYSGF